MMETPSLMCPRVRYLHRLSALEHTVAVYGYSIDSVYTRFDPEFSKCENTPGLEKFTDYTVWFGE
jgi:hypothetical protein